MRSIVTITAMVLLILVLILILLMFRIRGVIVNYFDLVITLLIIGVACIILEHILKPLELVVISLLSLLIIPYIIVETRTLIAGSQYRSLALKETIKADVAWPRRDIKILSLNIFSGSARIAVIARQRNDPIFAESVEIISITRDGAKLRVANHQQIYDRMTDKGKLLFPLYYLSG